MSASFHCFVRGFFIFDNMKTILLSAMMFISTIAFSQKTTPVDSAYDDLLKDSLINHGAYFRNGLKGWMDYLHKNIDPSVAEFNDAKVGKYEVRVLFYIGTDGSVIYTKPLTNNGYGLEEEVIRVLKKSPLWVPAIKNKQRIKESHIQSFTFYVSD